MEDIKQKLLEMRKTILEDLEQEQNRSKSSVTNEIGDDIDHASEERERELHQLLGERDRQKLVFIQQALDKIEESSYGVCEECEDEIGKKRLLALPFTKLCIECKTLEERTKGKGYFYDSSETNFGMLESSEADN
ncbi:MAG: DnaK suppressor protein [bacterium]|jgi:DnaK suppressor protein